MNHSHTSHAGDTGSIEVIQGLIEGIGILEHGVHVGNVRRPPRTNILVEFGFIEKEFGKILEAGSHTPLANGPSIGGGEFHIDLRMGLVLGNGRLEFVFGLEASPTFATVGSFVGML